MNNPSTASLSIDAIEVLKLMGSDGDFVFGRYPEHEVTEREGRFSMRGNLTDLTFEVRELIAAGMIEYSGIVIDTSPPLQPMVVTEKGLRYLAEGEKL